MFYLQISVITIFFWQISAGFAPFLYFYVAIKLKNQLAEEININTQAHDHSK